MNTKALISLLSIFLGTKPLLPGPCHSKEVTNSKVLFILLTHKQDRNPPKKTKKIIIHEILLEQQYIHNHPNVILSKKSISQLKEKLKKYKNNFYTSTTETMIP